MIEPGIDGLFDVCRLLHRGPYLLNRPECQNQDLDDENEWNTKLFWNGVTLILSFN